MHNHVQAARAELPGFTQRVRLRQHGVVINLEGIEEHFGWGKTIGRIRQTVYRGIRRVDQHFKLTMTASNIVRMARMLAAVPQGVGQ